MRKYRNYTDEDIIRLSKEVKSIAGLLRALEIKAVGGNYNSIKRHLQRLNIDTTHWTGSAWNKDQQLKDWSDYTRVVNLKPHLIKERGHECQRCNLTEWLERPITLEVEHVDGDNTNNNEDNLLLLCPNCHSQTPTWRRKKKMVAPVGLEPTIL